MRTRFIAAIACASCVALSSCGGDDPSGPWYGSVIGQLTEVESGEPELGIAAHRVPFEA